MSEILGTLFKYLVSLLGVAAVVLVLYQVFGSNKTQNAISDITLLQTNTQVLYSAQSSFATLTNAVAINAKLAPSNMISGATLTNPWGGLITITGNATQFIINSTLVPADACAKMAISLGNVVALKVGATGTVVVALPADAGTVAGQCAATNTMIMNFSA